jgi:glutamate/tyrosine decarboxylase-like PLP-dependent enzyme
LKCFKLLHLVFEEADVVTAEGAIYKRSLEIAAKYSQMWLDNIASRGINPTKSVDEMLEIFGGALPVGSTNPAEVIERMARLGEQGLMNMGSGRFFGWVIGGTLPAPLGADWLVSAWDQNAGMRKITPTVVALEEIAGTWIKDLLGLPATADVGFPTGATMANFTGLISARHKVMADVGWDVNQRGLNGAPAIRVLVGEERHITIDLALRYLGMGAPTVVPADSQGRIRMDELKKALESGTGPTILCLGAGEIHSGAFDPFEEAIELAHRHGAWVHVDGAFGLWALASPKLRPMLQGIEKADSWTTDAHKTLNVPYDCGIAIVAHPNAMHNAFSSHSDYLVVASSDLLNDPFEKTPELSRRARGVPVWAALASLGREGVAALVEGLVDNAKLIAHKLNEIEGCTVLNDVVFTQVTFAFETDAKTKIIGQRLIDDSAMWISGSRWMGRDVLRVSVSNWSTNESDIAVAIEAVKRASQGF